MKILITNTVALNGGDAAILQAAIRLLRARFGESSRFVVFDDQARVAKRLYPEIDFRQALHRRPGTEGGQGSGRRGSLHRRRARAAARAWRLGGRAAARHLAGPAAWDGLREYLTADLIASTGGTYLVERYDLRPRLFDLEMSLSTGKPLVLLPQSLGPFSGPRNRRVLARILRRAALVMARDERSLAHLRDLGVPPRKAVTGADLAFALADPGTLAAARRRTLPLDAPLRVAVSVREWNDPRRNGAPIDPHRFRAAIGRLVGELVEGMGAEVTFLSTCQGVAEYWTDDSKLADAIRAGLPSPVRARVAVDSGFHTPEELIGILGRMDLVVATRMHAAILALVAGTPAFPIAYEFKTAELFRRLGLEEWVEDYGALDGDRAAGRIREYLGAIPRLRGPLFDRVDRERLRAAETGARVARAVRDWRPGARPVGAGTSEP